MFYFSVNFFFLSLKKKKKNVSNQFETKDYLSPCFAFHPIGMAKNICTHFTARVQHIKMCNPVEDVPGVDS